MEVENAEPAVPDSTAVKSFPAPRVLTRIVEISTVKSLCAQVTDIYGRTKDKNFVTKLGFGAVEITAKAALSSTKLGYAVLPSLLKRGFEEKVVSRVDSLAAGGLDYLQTKLPVINTEAEKIIAAGINKVEQSEVADVLLTVTEAAIDYVKPSKHEPDRKAVNAGPPAVQTNIDRIRGVTNTVVGEGTKVLWYAASFPGKLMQAGMDGARSAAGWSWETSQNLLDILPVISRNLSWFHGTYRKGSLPFSSPIVGEKESLKMDFLKRKQKLRRSKRFKAKAAYHRMVDASDPFPISPDRKRKYDKEGGEDSIEELIYISKDYVSDEDPDYIPAEDELVESDSSDSHDDEQEDAKHKSMTTDSGTKIADSGRKRSVGGDAQQSERKHVVISGAVNEVTSPRSSSDVTSVKLWSVGPAQKEEEDQTAETSPNKTEERIAVGPARREKVVEGLASKPDHTRKVSPTKTVEKTSVGPAEKEKVIEIKASKADYSVKISPNKTEDRIAVGPAQKEPKVIEKVPLKADHTLKIAPNTTEDRIAVGPAQKEKVVEKIASKADHTAKGSPSKAEEKSASGSMQKEKGGETSKTKTDHVVKGSSHKGGGKCVV